MSKYPNESDGESQSKDGKGKELTPQSIAQVKPGDRFLLEGIEQDDFHERAEAFKKVAEKQGVSLGAIYHAPIKLGMIIVKAVKSRER